MPPIYAYVCRNCTADGRKGVIVIIIIIIIIIIMSIM